MPPAGYTDKLLITFIIIIIIIIITYWDVVFQFAGRLSISLA